jgi:5-(carboxyamino)imidazole ribonucleotide synthase
MANLLGQANVGEYRAALAAALQEPGARVHWYGKQQSRPGRKMGHITVAGKGDIVAAAKRARELFYGAWTAR